MCDVIMCYADFSYKQLKINCRTSSLSSTSSVMFSKYFLLISVEFEESNHSFSNIEYIELFFFLVKSPFIFGYTQIQLQSLDVWVDGAATEYDIFSLLKKKVTGGHIALWVFESIQFLNKLLSLPHEAWMWKCWTGEASALWFLSWKCLWLLPTYPQEDDKYTAAGM